MPTPGPSRGLPPVLLMSSLGRPQPPPPLSAQVARLVEENHNLVGSRDCNLSFLAAPLALRQARAEAMDFEVSGARPGSKAMGRELRGGLDHWRLRGLRFPIGFSVGGLFRSAKGVEAVGQQTRFLHAVPFAALPLWPRTTKSITPKNYMTETS